jgi:hypothetical protein
MRSWRRRLMRYRRPMKTKLITALIALLFGILGVGLALAGAHLYQDHRNLHALVDMVVKQQQAAQAKPAPAPAEVK